MIQGDGVVAKFVIVPKYILSEVYNILLIVLSSDMSALTINTQVIDQCIYWLAETRDHEHNLSVIGITVPKHLADGIILAFNQIKNKNFTRDTYKKLETRMGEVGQLLN